MSPSSRTFAALAAGLALGVALRRVLAEHTYAHRAGQLEEVLGGGPEAGGRSVRHRAEAAELA